MKKILASLFILLSITVFSAEKIAIERVEVKEEKVYLKGQQTPFTGVVEKKYPNGRVEATLEVKDGKLNGKTFVYSEDGKIKKEENYINGLMEGVERAYYPSGKLEFEVTNKNDLRNGIERHYSEEGKLIIEVPYQNDVVTGLVKQYTKEGKLEYETNYVNDKREGVSKKYYPSGKLLSQVTFKNDKEEGLMKGYSEEVKLEIESPTLFEEDDGVLTFQMEILNISDTFKNECELFDKYYCIQDLNNLIFIIAQNSNTPSHFQYVIHKTVSSFLDKYKESVLNISIGIGTIVDSIWKLNISYENACHALKYRFFYPNKNIFDALEATGKEFSLLNNSDSVEEEFISLLCKKDITAIEDWLRNFFNELSKKYENKNIIFIRIYSLLGKILRFLYEINIDTSGLEQKIIKVYSGFDTFHTYDQFFLWMKEICNLVCDKLSLSLKSYHYCIIKF